MNIQMETLPERLRGKDPVSRLRGMPVRRASDPLISYNLSSPAVDVCSFRAGHQLEKVFSQSLYQGILADWGLPACREGIASIQVLLKKIKPQHLEKSEKALLASMQAILSERSLRLNNDGEIDPEQPVGALAYQAVLRREGIEMSPQALEKLLNREVRILRQKVEQAARQVDPSMHWTELARTLKTRHPASKAEVFDAYRVSMERAHAFVKRHKLMDLPQQGAAVVQTPSDIPRDIPFSICPAAYYYPLRQMEVNWSDRPGEEAAVLAAHFKARIPLIAVHELYPGHHTAMSASGTQDKHIPERQVGDASFFCEGWASYAEKLMMEQGFFTQPEERFYALLHHLKLADKAMKNLTIHSGGDASEFSAPEIAHHIDRGYDLASYYLGMLQIERLKNLVMQTYPDMTLRAFHNRLVHTPEMPLPQMAKVAFGIDLPPLTGPESLQGAGAATYAVGSPASDSSVASATKDGKGLLAKTDDKMVHAFSLP